MLNLVKPSQVIEVLNKATSRWTFCLLSKPDVVSEESRCGGRKGNSEQTKAQDLFGKLFLNDWKEVFRIKQDTCNDRVGASRMRYVVGPLAKQSESSVILS